MILVIAEAREGRLNPASWEAVAAAQSFGLPIKIAGPPAAAEIAAARCEAFYVFSNKELEEYTADGYTHAIATLAGMEGVLEGPPVLVIAAHTYQARDVMPRVAARLDRPLITDCIGVTPGSPAVFKRPMFQSKLVADVVPLGPTPHFVTVQLGAFRADAAVRGEKPAEFVNIEITDGLGAIRQKPEPPFREAKQAVDLTQAPRIVSVGRGIKGEEHIQLAKDLAAALGAELAASRPIIDAGWLPSDRQVGSSGQTVAPKLYLALGISGAIQHVVGMKGARTIVAVNKDPDAPIFEIADYGIVGDLFEVVPAMIAELKKA
jgi:electron transfer flavoprotein alpha subunit